MLTKEQARKHIEKALSLASFPECDIRIDSLEKASIRFALNGVTTSGVTVEQWMTISSGKEGRFGSTTLSEFDDKSIRDAVKRSEELATLSPPNPERIEPVGPQKYPELENFGESTASARNEAFIPHIRAIIEAAKGKDLVAAGFFERASGAVAIANKRGNFGYGRNVGRRTAGTV